MFGYECRSPGARSHQHAVEPIDGQDDGEGDQKHKDADDYEQNQFGGTPFFDGADDPDGDGVPNTDEYVTGTDASDGGSHFLVDLNVTENGNERHISWDTVSGRLYQLEGRDDLLGSMWRPIGNPVVGTGEPVSLMDDQPAENCYYRVGVTLPAGQL